MIKTLGFEIIYTSLSHNNIYWIYPRNIGCDIKIMNVFKTHVEQISHSCLVLAGHKVQDLVGSYSM